MNFDGKHLVTLGIGIAIGFFIVPMLVAWVSGQGSK